MWLNRIYSIFHYDIKNKILFLVHIIAKYEFRKMISISLFYLKLAKRINIKFCEKSEKKEITLKFINKKEGYFKS